MGNIIVLDEDTANRIAAGEVIERPSSVVKELVENSLDAGAAKISVDISKGGIARVCVSDDGEGFFGDDVLLAFERYATSKLRSAGDLERVATLGFRGEALPSIASVSKVRLVTRRRDAEYGRLVEIHAGKLVRDEETGCPYGTSITVSELFYNLPARYKFLKNDSAEAAQISELMGRLAIGNPGVSFTLTTQSARILHTQGGGKPEEAIFAVLGKEIYACLAPVRGTGSETMNYSVSGFIGKPEISRANRNFQFFYVNGRLIKNRVVSAAVSEAYKTHIPAKRFPVAILYITIDAPLVDVNAHPAKTEVRFQNESELFRAVYRAAEAALGNMDVSADAAGCGGAGEGTQGRNVREDGGPQSWGVRGADSGPLDGREYTAHKLPGRFSYQEHEPPGGGAQADGGAPAKLAYRTLEPRHDEHTRVGEQPQNAVWPDAGNDLTWPGPPDLVRTPAQIMENSPARTQVYTPVQEEFPAAERMAAAGEGEEIVHTALFGAARYIGQLFGTYLLFEHGDALVLVDQHAAHERVLYEKIKVQYEKSAVSRQMLLESITVNLLPDEMLFVRDAGPVLEKAGFAIEEFGREAVVLREVPLYMERSDARAFFLETLEIIRRDFELGKNAGGAAVLFDKTLYDIACKAAVKGNRPLSAMEASELLRALDALPKPLTCPHGRPLIVTSSKREFDKKFRRV